MKRKFNNSVSLKILFISISLVLLNSCTNDVTPTLYPGDGDKGTPAEITKVTPAEGYAGVTSIIIDGSNFSENADDNFVFFGAARATVLNASATQLNVLAPVIYGDSLRLKVDNGSDLYSNTILYKLGYAVNEYYPFLANQEPYAATVDKDGNLYFSYIEAAKGLGVWRITAAGVLSEYAPKGGETTFNDLKYNSGGYLIGIYGNRAIFKIEEGIKPAVFVNTGDNSVKLLAFDFDKDTTIWAGGKGGKIVGVKPDKSFKFFEYEYDISGLRVYNDYLYAISGDENSQNVVRFPIVSPDSLGAVEPYFAFSSNVEFGVLANSLTFSADGQMYIATSPLSDNSDPVDPIMFVNSDGSFGTWYAGLAESSVSSFTWGIGTNMYIIRDRFPVDRAVDAVFTQSILKVDMERLGAPEFGRD